MINIAFAEPIKANDIGNALSPLLTHIVSPIIWLLFAAAVVLFSYGLFRLIISGDVSDESRSQAKWSVVGGLIGMFIMLSAWGIIQIVANTVNSI